MSSELRLVSAARLTGLACAVLLLAACGSDAPAPAAGPQRVAAPLPPDALPGCAAIGEALGSLVAGLKVVDPAGTRQTAPESHGMSLSLIHI